MRSTLVFLLLAAAGCSTDVTNDIVKLKDRMCACTEVTCARAVLDDLVQLARNTRNARGDEDKTQAAGREMAACAVKQGVQRSELEATFKKISED